MWSYTCACMYVSIHMHVCKHIWSSLCRFESDLNFLKWVTFLRKSKIFNKSRYSRNRQNTRVAFYLSVLINILVIFAVFSLYYKVLFKLSIIWWFFFTFLLSFVFGSFIRTFSVTKFKSFLYFLKSLSHAVKSVFNLK